MFRLFCQGGSYKVKFNNSKDSINFDIDYYNDNNENILETLYKR